MKTRPKRLRAALAAAGVLAVAGAVAIPLAASAHTPEFKVSCTSASIDLTNYPAGSTVSGTLDGVDLGTVTFGAEGYHGHVALDPAVPHTWNVVVKSGDGDHRYDRTYAGTSDPACLPVVPPTDEPSAPETTAPSADVIIPQIQDYITCKGGAFVLDNTGSTVPVTYTINDLPFVVPAGQAVHTDADGTLLQPNSDFEGYTIKAGDRTWNFPSAGNCPVEPTQPPTVEPTEPAVTDPPATEEPTPPVTTPPTDQPTTPVTPSEQPTAPSPTDGTSQPSSSPVAHVPSSSTTPHAVSAVASTLAYTGSPLTVGAQIGLLAAAVLGIGFGALLLTLRTIRRRKDDRG